MSGAHDLPESRELIMSGAHDLPDFLPMGSTILLSRSS